MQNHFDLFQLPQQFNIDLAQLDKAYREVQSQVHPDKFVQAGDAERRVAMQWATRANEAYQVLKKPLPRAMYLCELHGIDLQAESNTHMPAVFLMQQMEWREAFDEARNMQDSTKIDALENALQSALKRQIAVVGTMLDAGEFQVVAQEVRICMFLEKFMNDVLAHSALSD